MSRRPWFKFYANDFYMDTLGLSDAQVGFYLRLLIVQWKCDRITKDNAIGNANWDAIAHHFASEKIDGIEFVFNPRMRETIEEAKNKSLKASANANKRWKRNADAMQKHTIQHTIQHPKNDANQHACQMSEENSLLKENAREGEVEIYSNDQTDLPDLSDGTSLADFHARWRLSFDPKFGRQMTGKLLEWGPWYQSRINMGEIDPNDVREVLTMAKDHGYWREKLMSPEALLKESEGVPWIDKCRAALSVAEKKSETKSNGAQKLQRGRPADFDDVIEKLQEEAGGEW